MSFPKSYTKIVLAERPQGTIDPERTFRVVRDNAFPKQEDLKENEVVVKVDCVSIDPGEDLLYLVLGIFVNWGKRLTGPVIPNSLSFLPCTPIQAMRGWLNDVRSYVPPVQIGEIMRADGIGLVVMTGKGVKGFAVGETVRGVVGWTEYATVKTKDLQKVPNIPGVTPSDHLGILGFPGQTAYWGLIDVGKIKAGETVVISGAAGAVGATACQIAKIKGCRVIAIAGSEEKNRWLRETCGIDETLNYKDPNFKADFRKKVGYLDVYFDNVGGEILDLALGRLNQRARIVVCGGISQYNTSKPTGIGPSYLALISQRARMEGFIVFDYVKRFSESARELAQWINEGKLHKRETRYHGIERSVDALVGLFEGKNTGKMVVDYQTAPSKL